MGNYQDIISTKWMGVRKHKQMQRKERAKIFMSFSALKGYEESIEDKRKFIEEHTEFSDEFLLLQDDIE